MSSVYSVVIYSSISPANYKMVSEPLVLQEDYVVTEAADDALNILTLRVLVLVTCTAAGNYGQQCIFRYCYGSGFLNELIIIKGV